MKAIVRIDRLGSVIYVKRDEDDDMADVKRLFSVCCFDHNSDPRPVLDGGLQQDGFDILVEPKDEPSFVTLLRQAGVRVVRVAQA